MERTESMIIEVAPNHENAKIKEFEVFGWSLQNRQEMVVEGDTRPDLSVPALIGDAISKTRTSKTEIKRYVKLHFVRSLALPNLDKVKEIESEYYNLPFPSVPTEFKVKDNLRNRIFIVAGALVVMGFVVGQGGIGITLGIACIGVVSVRTFILAAKEGQKATENTRKIHEQSKRKAEELLAQLEKFLS